MYEYLTTIKKLKFILDSNSNIILVPESPGGVSYQREPRSPDWVYCAL